MLVLPNSFERYLASLRYYISFSIQKYGIRNKNIEALRKIYLCEAIYYRNLSESTDISVFVNNLLNAAAYILPNTEFKVNISGNRYINKALLSALLLTVIKNSSLSVSQEDEFLHIRYWGNNKKLSPIIKALRGIRLFETKNGESLVIIPAPKADTPPFYTESEWEYLFDEFSVVNLFLKKYDD